MDTNFYYNMENSGNYPGTSSYPPIGQRYQPYEPTPTQAPGAAVEGQEPRGDYLTTKPKPAKGLSAIFGIAFLVFAIIGLVIFYVLPWFTNNYRPTEDEIEYGEWEDRKYIGHWDQDLEWKDGDSKMKDDKGDNLFKNQEEKRDLLKDTIDLSFLGVILAIILSIIATVFGFISIIHTKWPKVGNTLDVVFGAIILLPACLIVFSSLRFLGLNIEDTHTNYSMADIGQEVRSFWYYYAAYALLIIGLIILMAAIVLIIMGLNRLKKRVKAESSRGTTSTNKVISISEKIIIASIILCIIGLIFIPLLPWLGVSDEFREDDDEKEVTLYNSESSIHVVAEQIQSIGSSGNIEDFQDSIGGLSNNIGYITILFWLALLFLIFGIIGVAIYRIANRYAEIIGKIFIMIGAFALIFGILIVVFSGLCFKNVVDLQSAVDAQYEEYEEEFGGFENINPPRYFLGYNYIPLIMGISILILTAIYMAGVLPKLAKSFRRYPPDYYPVRPDVAAEYDTGPYRPPGYYRPPWEPPY